MSGEAKEEQEYEETANLPATTGAVELIGGKRGGIISPCLPPSCLARAIEAAHEAGLFGLFCLFFLPRRSCTTLPGAQPPTPRAAVKRVREPPEGTLSLYRVQPRRRAGLSRFTGCRTDSRTRP